jgi:3-methyl-2-oxobutanoate hydroxymethyltransferase
MAYLQTDVTKVTTNVLQRMKQNGEKIAMLTAYDYSMAKLLDATKIDVVLVGDSAANVMEGFDTTLPITLDEMIVYASSVKRAIKRALVVVDMPFGTYQGNSKQALASAIRIMKETGADAVKLEGGEEVLESISRILTAGIPVMGHLGLTPQSIAFRGGTDGSALSHRGLPCPNLSAGYENAHGRFEYVPIPSMEKNVEILLHLAKLFGEMET